MTRFIALLNLQLAIEYKFRETCQGQDNRPAANYCECAYNVCDIGPHAKKA
jgi:hypothetical protein